MEKIVFVSAQPDTKYFHWQVEVFLHNAISKGIDPKNIHLLFAYDELPTQEGLDLAKKYDFAGFFFYKKKVTNNFGYIPVLRPDILEQHFLKFPELKNRTIFYHDADIIFRELPDFDSLDHDQNWYLSDTISYVGADYIKSKGDSLLGTLCRIAGISEDVVIKNQDNSGGAQYLLKGIDHLFWSDVKSVSMALYKYMADEEEKERKTLSEEQLKTYNPIQKWCADMWAVLWCGLKIGKEVKISRELDFSWSSTMGHEEWQRCKILHNAGITSSHNGKVFYKGDFIDEDPWDFDFSKIDPKSNSSNYVKAILYAKEVRSRY